MLEMKTIYDIQTCKSSVEEAGTWSTEKLTVGLLAAIKETMSGHAVCWLHNTVLIGRVEEGYVEFYNNQQPDYPHHLLRLRIFNAERECHIWRTGPDFKYRKRLDGRGEASEYVEAVQPIWGTQASPVENTPNWSRIFESRGTELYVPFSGLFLDERENRLSIVTRNYISKTSQAGYVDCRFVKFDLPGGKR